jgi:hypothetical protein
VIAGQLQTRRSAPQRKKNNLHRAIRYRVLCFAELWGLGWPQKQFTTSCPVSFKVISLYPCLHTCYRRPTSLTRSKPIEHSHRRPVATLLIKRCYRLEASRKVQKPRHMLRCRISDKLVDKVSMPRFKIFLLPYNVNSP